MPCLPRLTALKAALSSPCAPAMLAGKRASVGQDEIGDLVGDRLELCDAAGGLQVDHRADVKAPDRRVRVDAGNRVMALHDFHEVVDVIPQFFRRDRGVFHERDRLVVGLHDEPSAIVRAGDRRLITLLTVALPAAVDRVRGLNQLSEASLQLLLAQLLLAITFTLA